MKINEQLKIIKLNIPSFKLEIKKVDGHTLYEVSTHKFKKTFNSMEIIIYLEGVVDVILLRK